MSESNHGTSHQAAEAAPASTPSHADHSASSSEIASHESNLASQISSLQGESHHAQDAWLYVFSKFTPEALLFESLFIFMLCAGYAAFWILRKRRLGSVHEVVPVGVIKGYLNEWIGDAEQLRAQLFGLLGAAGAEGVSFRTSMPSLAHASGSVSADPVLLTKIQMLEAKMAEQNKSIESVAAEKARIEKELALAKAAKPGSAPSGDSDGAMSDLQNKIQLLEGKLAEYSIIEDDLANLKRLQQENAQLKAQLAGQGGTFTPTPSAPSASSTPAPEAHVAEPTPDEMPEPAMTAEPMAEMEATSNQPDPSFENIVDQVEQSLQPETITENASEPSPEPMIDNKSDADLVEEFEKMLNA